MSNPDPIVIHLQAKDDGVNEVFDSATRATKKNEKAVQDTLKRMNQYRKELGMSQQQLQLYKLAQLGATKEQIKSARRLQRLTEAKEKDISVNKRLNGSLRMIRGGFGQVGHQLQDITIQAQMGTDAFIILGQQGSQIASLFGSRGAMYGAVLAVGAAFVTFMKNTYGAADSLEELKEVGQEIDKLFGTSLAMNVKGVSDELRQLAEDSQELALTEILLGNAAASERLQDAYTQLNDVLSFTRTNTLETKGGMDKIALSSAELARELGISEEQATRLSTTFDGLKTNAFEGRDAFLAVANSILVASDSDKFKEFVTEVKDLTIQAGHASSQIKNLADLRSQLEGGGFLPEDEGRSRDQLQAIIDRNTLKTLAGEDQIKAAMKARIDETIDAMKKLGKSEVEQKQMKLALEGELSRQISDMQNKRLQEFNKLDDARQKDAANLEKSRAQVRAVHKEELTGLDAINQKYDLKLQKVENLASKEPRILAEASAEIIQINADRAKAIDKFHEDEYLSGVKALEKDRQAHLDHQDSIKKMMDDGKNAFMQDLQARAYALEVALAERAINETEHTEYRKQLQTEYANHLLEENLKIVGGLKHVEDSFVNASHAFITGAQNGTEAIQQFGRAIVDELIKSLVQMGVEHVKQMVIKKQIEAKGLGASVAMNAGAMSAIAAASAPAAALVSLATAGGNAAPAVTGMGTAFAASRAMSLASFDGGGFTGMGARAGGVDGKGGFPAILHPNETVIDHTRGQGQGITIINNIDASGNQDVDEKIAIAVTQSSRQTVEQVHNMMRRGRM